MKKALSTISGGLVAFGISALFIFVLGAHTKITVFGADPTLIFFESFFINIISALVVEWVQKSGIEDAIIDALASILVSLGLAWYTAQPEVHWLSTADMWKSTWIYTVVGGAVVVFAAFGSTTVRKKLSE